MKARQSPLGESRYCCVVTGVDIGNSVATINPAVADLHSACVRRGIRYPHQTGHAEIPYGQTTLAP